MVLAELRKVLVNVEDDGDTDNQQYGIDVRTDELTYDIPVENFYVSQRVKDVQYPKEGKLACSPCHCLP